MGTISTSDEKNDGNEKNAHKVLIIRTKDSNGHLLVGGNEETGYYHSTKYISFKVPFKDLITIALSLWDTPAIDFSVDVHEKIAAPYYEYAHGIICVYNPESVDSFKSICQKITWFYKNPNQSPFKDISKVSIILVGHKTDLFTEKLRKVPQEHAIKYANAMDIKCVEISSSESKDMHNLYVNIARSIYHIHGELPLKEQKQNGSEVIISSELLKETQEQKINENDDDDEKKQNNLDLPSRNRERPNIIDKPSKHRSSDELPNKKRSTMELPAKKKSSHELQMENPVSIRFRKFIEDKVGETYLYELFVKSHYDDIRMIEYFNEDMLENEIGIKNQIHRKLFLGECYKLKMEIMEFRTWLIDKLQLRRYLHVFEANGLITLNMIAEEINGEHEFVLKLKIMNKAHCKILWEELDNKSKSVDDHDDKSSNTDAI